MPGVKYTMLLNSHLLPDLMKERQAVGPVQSSLQEVSHSRPPEVKVPGRARVLSNHSFRSAAR